MDKDGKPHLKLEMDENGMSYLQFEMTLATNQITSEQLAHIIKSSSRPVEKEIVDENYKAELRTVYRCGGGSGSGGSGGGCDFSSAISTITNSPMFNLGGTREVDLAITETISIHQDQFKCDKINGFLLKQSPKLDINVFLENVTHNQTNLNDLVIDLSKVRIGLLKHHFTDKFDKWAKRYSLDKIDRSYLMFGMSTIGVGLGIGAIKMIRRIVRAVRK